uniref:Senataxin n=1 Tax=Tetraselmis sp. GSL018 TaxID=582737 RepID=A0A061SGN7_9CHLO
MKAMDAVGRNWWAVPAGDLTTVRRETDALLNMKGSSLSQVILDPRIMAERRAKQTAEQQWPHEVAQQGYNEALKRKYDFSQLKAIEESCAHLSHPCFGGGGREDAPWLPFTLIQGPPGTGKTHTVRGILNTWHLVQYQRYYTSLVACLAPKSKIAAEWRQSRGRNSSLNSGVQDIYSGQLSSAEVDDRLLLLPGVEPQPRILVCAPSNAATDELLQRIMNIGFRAGNGSMYWPNVVRVGSEAAPLSQRARDVWVDNIVNQYLSATDISAVISKRDERLREAQRHLGALCHHGQLALQPGADTDRLATEAAQIYDAWYKARQEVVKLNLVISYMQTQHRRHRNELELELVKNAEIIFTTLSSSGRQIFSRLSERKCVKFETVLIDEACQASEVSVLQPLMYGCRKCVLVGDPQQLPATVLSLKAKEHQMERSLFERLQHASCPVHMLMVQYRMHPEIRHFPSDHFYEGKLQDGDCILQRADPPFYSHSLLKPYIFFDVDQGRELRMGGRSLSNQAEADLAAALYVSLQKTLKELEWSEPVSVGVITPYREQRNCLKKTFKSVCGEAKAGEVFIETVDSFQGRQLDVVMLSCVRASSSRSGIGFVGDIRRLNVAITRAQLALWVLGDAATLGLSPTWRALIEDAERRRRIIPNASARSLFPEQFRPSDPRPQPGQQPLEPAQPPAVWPSDPRQSAGAMPNPMGQAQRAQSVSQPNAEVDPHSRAMAAWSEGA